MIRRDRASQLTELLMEVDDSTISIVIDGAIEQGEIGEIICALEFALLAARKQCRVAQHFLEIAEKQLLESYY